MKETTVFEVLWLSRKRPSLMSFIHFFNSHSRLFQVKLVSVDQEYFWRGSKRTEEKVRYIGIRIPKARGRDPIFASIQTSPTLFMRAVKHQIVVIGSLLSPTLVGIAAARKLLRRPTLLTIDTGEGFEQRPSLRHLKKILIRGFFHAFLAMSPLTQRFLLGIGVEKERIFLPYWGIDTNNFSPSERKFSYPVRFLFAGRMVPIKGLKYLLKAMIAVREKEKRFTFTFAGHGPMAPLVKDFCRLNQWAKFIGAIPYEKMPSLYKSHDVFVLPSLFEVWGIALLEAASSGLALISSSKCGAAKFLCLPNKSGFVVAPRDVNGLATSMLTFIRHPHLIQQFGRRATELASNWSAHRALESLEKAFSFVRAHLLHNQRRPWENTIDEDIV